MRAQAPFPASNPSTTRRALLRLGALAPLAACLPALPAQTPSSSSGPAMQPAPFKLGLASYTLRNFDRAFVIAAMKQLRLDNLNAKDVKDHLPSTSPEQEIQAIDAYRAAGIHLNAAGTIPFPKDEDNDIRAKFEYCKRAGVRTIVAGDPSLATLPRLEKFVKQYDIRLAIHNHGPEDKLFFPSPLDVLKAVHTLDPRIGCCIDVGHTMRAGTDVVQAIHAIGPRLFDVHMKDLARPDAKDSQVAVGEGIMPVKQIFQALMEVHYQGFVDLEYEIFPENPMPGVIESFAYMRGVLAGMGFRT